MFRAENVRTYEQINRFAVNSVAYWKYLMNNFTTQSPVSTVMLGQCGWGWELEGISTYGRLAAAP